MVDTQRGESGIWDFCSVREWSVLSGLLFFAEGLFLNGCKLLPNRRARFVVLDMNLVATETETKIGHRMTKSVMGIVQCMVMPLCCR